MKGVYKGISAASILAASMFTTAYADASKDVIAVGPVDLVEAGSITVMGRQFRIEDTSGLVAGDKVAVHGALQPDGSASNAWAETIGAYTPGSDPIYETGVVTKVDVDSGHLSIGDSDIDYTATLASSDATIPSLGQLVSVSGIQPTVGGVILGSTTSAGVTGMNVALAGSAQTAAARGTTGSNVASISGSGSGVAAARGTTGSNVASISGSGSGTSSISGSGSGTSSISGSGSGTSSISGSGSGTSSISGSGSGTSSISGSGSGTESISGSGNGSG